MLLDDAGCGRQAGYISKSEEPQDAATRFNVDFHQMRREQTTQDRATHS